MNADRLRRLQELFDRAVALPAAEREPWLAEQCADDPGLLARVLRLLADDDRNESALDELQEGLQQAVRDPRVGRSIGPYRIVSRIAVGGMGVVYRAERTDGLFDHAVAVKLVRSEVATEDVLRRFEFERRTLASLGHPNIARLFDGGTTEEGTPYFVMELIEGLPIDRYCATAKLSIEERLRLFVTVCGGVHHAHQHLVVHRDLKPSNILVDRAGSPKLLDFGIARLLQSDAEREDAEPTRTIARVLTPEYASPEQLSGGALTTATDVYSLGVVLYELLTGKKPFRWESRSPADWERIVTTQPPTRPSTAVVGGGSRVRDNEAPRNLEAFAAACSSTPARLRRRISGDLDRIVMMALRKEPERRYDSVRQFLEDVEQHLAGRPVLARADSLGYRARKFVVRNRLAIAAGVLVFGALGFGWASARHGERMARREVQHTQIEAESFRAISDFLIETFLGVESFEEGTPERVLEQVRDQVAIVRRRYAANVHLRANLLDALGRVCLRMGGFDEAEPLLEEARALRRDKFGTESLEVALSLGSLGELHFRRGDYARAEEALRRALELHRTLPRGTHTDVPVAANDLAVTLRNLGATEEAERLHREALALRRADDPRSILVAESLNNLGGVHLDRGDLSSASAEFAESLEIRRAVFGEGHPMTLQSLSNLANVRFRERDADASRALLVEAADGFRALGAEAHPGLGRTLGNLAVLELGERRWDEAEAYFQEAYELQVERLGSDHPSVAMILTQIGTMYGRRGLVDEGSEAWSEALRVLRDADPPSPLALGQALLGYGVFLVDCDRPAEAEAPLREALDHLTATATPSPDLVGRAHAALGSVLLRTSRASEAGPELRAALELMARGGNATERDLEHVRGLLAAVEGRTDDSD